MHLDALRTIGEAIASEEFVDEFDRFYTASRMADTQAIVVVRLVEAADGTLSYDETYLRAPEDPVDMAHTYAFAYNHKTDRSITQRIAGSPRSNIERMLEWPDQEAIGDARDAPIIAALREAFERDRNAILEDTAAMFDLEDDDQDQEQEGGDGGLSPSSAEPVFVTIEIADDPEQVEGEGRFPGAIPAIREGIRHYSGRTFEKKSQGKGMVGDARCAVCDAETRVYGAGAYLDRTYALKQQWAFADTNASEAWRNRPLCVDCITAINTAVDRFLEPQQYTVPGGITCRVVPYALPVEGGDEQLRRLISAAREDLLGTESYPARDGDERATRPLKTAWDEYRGEVDIIDREDALRLSVVHYKKNKSRREMLSWIDGVSVPAVDRVEQLAAEIVERPAYLAALQPGDPKETGNYVAPTERQIWSGMWAYDVLASESSAVGTDPSASDDPVWIAVTAALLVDGTVPYETVSSAIADEMIARYQSDRDEYQNLESEIDDPYYSPPYDGVHAAEVYCLVATLDVVGVIDRDGDDADNDQDTSMNTTETDTEQDQEQALEDDEPSFQSLAEAVEWYLERDTWIDRSPGRTAAFGMGVMASALSAWQQRRGLNRTFLQSVTPEDLDLDELQRMKTRIWEKSTTYNSQNGRTGTPWSGLHVIVDKAIRDARTSGLGAPRDDLASYFITGAVAGPRLNAHVDSDSGGDDEDDDAESSSAADPDLEIDDDELEQVSLEDL